MPFKRSGLPFPRLVQFAWRNLWRNRRRTLVTLSSIALGFGLAVLFIGLSDGGHNSMIRNAIKLGEGHITIQPLDYFQAPSNHKFLINGDLVSKQLAELEIPGQVQQRVSLQVLASTAHNSVPVQLEGVATENDHRLNMLKPLVSKQQTSLQDSTRGIIIGDGLASKLRAKTNSKVVLMAGIKGGDSQAQLARVYGIFDSGLNELDDYMILSDIRFAQQFLQAGQDQLLRYPVTRFAIYLDNPGLTAQWIDRISLTLGSDNFQILGWSQMMPQLMQYIALDNAGNYVFLILILIMVVIGIINTVLMSVLERTREFGLLRALGIDRTSLIKLVFFETFLLSLLAVITGWIIGGAVHMWFSINGLDLSGMIGEGTSIAGTYMDPVVFTELSWYRVTQLTLIIFVCTLITGIYPAIKAARVTPVEALST